MTGSLIDYISIKTIPQLLCYKQDPTCEHSNPATEGKLAAIEGEQKPSTLTRAWVFLLMKITTFYKLN